MITPRRLILVSMALLGLAATFSLLNLRKTRALRSEVAWSETTRIAADQERASREKQLDEREVAVAATNLKFAEAQNKAMSSEAELAKVRAEKEALLAKLRANESEITDLRKRIETSETEPVAGPSPPASIAELQAQLEDARKQLEAAEREKILLSDKMKALQDKAAELETERKHRGILTPNNPGIRGTVLAVNQAYNFVVLSLGARQGVEANTEMLVLRGGSFIGKIRISSVEPATAIGDIITSTLARGVQVQPGDTVVYAGNNS